jgi:hypothetical protein
MRQSLRSRSRSPRWPSPLPSRPLYHLLLPRPLPQARLTNPAPTLETQTEKVATPYAPEKPAPPEIKRKAEIALTAAAIEPAPEI